MGAITQDLYAHNGNFLTKMRKFSCRRYNIRGGWVVCGVELLGMPAEGGVVWGEGGVWCVMVRSPRVSLQHSILVAQ